MTHIQLFLEELDREVTRSRHALEQVPANSRDWKPHEKSMAFGPLCDMVATIPSWMAMILQRDSLDVAPKETPSFTPPRSTTAEEYLQALDAVAAEGPREGGVGVVTPPDAARDHQPLGASPRADDGVSAPARGEGAIHLRAVGRRRDLWIETGARSKYDSRRSGRSGARESIESSVGGRVRSGAGRGVVRQPVVDPGAGGASEGVQRRRGVDSRDAGGDA